MKIRTVLDTNLWISYLISKRLSRIDHLFERDDIVFLFSTALLEEFIEVACRPRFRRFFPIEDIEELVDLFDEYGEIIDVRSIVSVCRDPKDNFLLALSKDGQADFLVTGDKNLLVLEKFGTAEIVKFSHFESRISTYF